MSLSIQVTEPNTWRDFFVLFSSLSLPQKNLFTFPFILFSLSSLFYSIFPLSPTCLFLPLVIILFPFPLSFLSFPPSIHLIFLPFQPSYPLSPHFPFFLFHSSFPFLLFLTSPRVTSIDIATNFLHKLLRREKSVNIEILYYFLVAGLFYSFRYLQAASFSHCQYFQHFLHVQRLAWRYSRGKQSLSKRVPRLCLGTVCSDCTVSQHRSLM